MDPASETFPWNNIQQQIHNSILCNISSKQSTSTDLDFQKLCPWASEGVQKTWHSYVVTKAIL
jgi:hypothetical protein